MKTDFPILIVDDNVELSTVLQAELQDEGYQVYTASNGWEGLLLLSKYPIKLVILDIRLPEMDGFEILQLIKRNYPRVRVVMITAHADVHHAMESRRLGADDFVGKPYDLGEVLSVIERLRVG
jgi:DNA-binding response OmpR family regulator